MSTSTDAPKVFISYSWRPVNNKERTIKLAERLESEGVNVIIDVWNLSEGQDKYHFMEQMVNDPEVKKVLIICNKDYAEKANGRAGGVGIESLIISDEIYSQAEQTKFVPVIFERDDEKKEFVPTFIKSRIYIDLSSENIFEEEYEKLMRNIFDRPANKRPPRGTAPAYLFQEESVYVRTTHKKTAVKNALINGKPNANAFIEDYYSTFLEALNDFEISAEKLNGDEPIDDLVYNKIEEMKLLREDFTEFFENLITYSDLEIDGFISFLERLVEFSKNQDTGKNYIRNGQFMADHFKFFFYELFLYTSVILIEKEKFKVLSEILKATFVIYVEKYSRTETYNYTFFRQYVESLDDTRNNRLGLRRISITADLIKSRADSRKNDFNKLKEADVLLYYLSIMNKRIPDSFGRYKWFPITSCYDTYTIRLIDKMISKRFFEKVKVLFDVNNIEQLTVKINEAAKEDNIQSSRFEYNIPHLNRIMDLEKICSVS